MVRASGRAVSFVGAAGQAAPPPGGPGLRSSLPNAALAARCARQSAVAEHAALDRCRHHPIHVTARSVLTMDTPLRWLRVSLVVLGMTCSVVDRRRGRGGRVSARVLVRAHGSPASPYKQRVSRGAAEARATTNLGDERLRGAEREEEEDGAHRNHRALTVRRRWWQWWSATLRESLTNGPLIALVVCGCRLRDR